MPIVFDLEKAIAAWRRPFEHNRAFSVEDLEELESSLRDRVDALLKAGRSEEAAFKEALRRMGAYGTAEEEYRKVYWGKRKRQRQLRNELSWRFSMLKNYLKIAFRNLLRQKSYSFINIAGLTLGLTCCLLIFQYVAFEYSFDRFNENASTLYRVIWTRVQNEGAPTTGATTGWAVGPALAEEVPEVVGFARLHPESAIISNLAQPGKVYEEEKVYYADPAFFQMFSYPLVQGDAGHVLSEPGTVLLSESAAHKYFGSEDPIGGELDIRAWISGTFRVGGIFQDVPANSHLQIDFLLPMGEFLERSDFSNPSTGWGWNNFITFVQLREDADQTAVERKFTDVYMRHREDYFRESNITAEVEIQPLLDIHLNEDIHAPSAVMGSYRAVYFFTVVGLITLLIALVNYINLATARALDRAREIGVRKVVGAQRRQLVTQFLCESALTNFTAVVLAVALAVTLRPVINNLVGTNLTNVIWAGPAFWTLFFAAFCAATLLAGLYPAFVLSSFRPVAVLKAKDGSFAARAWLRRGLVVLQFAASIVLLIGTIVVYGQLDFMRNMDLGINLEQILTVSGPRVLPEGTDQAVAVETFTEQLRQLPAVRQTATSQSVPGRGFMYSTNNLRRATADPSTEVSAAATLIDTSFADLYGFEWAAGEGFDNISYSTPEGEPRPIVVNEAAVQALGFDTPADAVGQELSHGRIVGVFKDFNWSSAHEARKSVIFELGRGNPQVSIKVTMENLPQTIASIEEVYKRLFPDDPFRYAFVDEQFEQQYRNDQRFATLFSIFASLAIVIACLGLFGLATFTAQQRRKEIGVRKVLGASVPGIATLLSKDFLRLVVFAFIVAAPVAYVAMGRWLENFAYRTEMGPGVFLLVGGLVLLIALAAVSYQSVKAALADPVKSLRYE